MTKKILITVLFIFVINAVSQTDRILDSLNALLSKNPEDTDRVKILCELAMNYRFIDINIAKRHASDARELAQKTEFTRGILKSHNVLASIYSAELDYDKAILEYSAVAEMLQKANRKNDLANTYINLGWAYSGKINYSKALEYDFMALNILDELHDERNKAIVLGNIGIIHWNNGNVEKAISMTEAALAMDLKNKNMANVARHLGNLGSFYSDEARAFRNKGDEAGAKKKYNLSIEKLTEANRIYEEMGDKKGMAMQFGNMANSFWDLGDTSKTLEYYKKAFSLDSSIGNKEGMSRHLGNVAWTNMEMKHYKMAETNFKKALVLSYELNNIQLLHVWHEDISVLYEKMNMHDSALVHYKTSIMYRDSIYNLENTKRTLRAEMNFELAKKEAEAREQNARQSLYRNVFVGGFFVMLIIVLLVFRSYRIKQRANKLVSQQKELLEIKNKEITDSILYAKRIQNAHLPSTDYISKKLNELKKL